MTPEPAGMIADPNVRNGRGRPVGRGQEADVAVGPLGPRRQQTFGKRAGGGELTFIEGGASGGGCYVLRMGSKLASYLVAGAVAGLLFFTALIALILGGLREPYVSILVACAAGAVLVVAYLKASRARRDRGGLPPGDTGSAGIRPTRLPGIGPNFFIWIAIGVVIASTIPALFGYDRGVWIGYPLAIGLAIFNKVRAVRRRRAEASQTLD